MNMSMYVQLDLCDIDGETKGEIEPRKTRRSMLEMLRDYFD